MIIRSNVLTHEIYVKLLAELGVVVQHGDASLHFDRINGQFRAVKFGPEGRIDRERIDYEDTNRADLNRFWRAFSKGA